jgi:signal transduction histidine kinase
MFVRPRRRLLGWNLLVLALILLVVFVSVYLLLVRSMMAEVDRNLMSHGDEIDATVQEASEPNGHHDYDGYRGDLFYIVAGPRGDVIANPQQVDLSSIPPALLHVTKATFANATIAGGATRLFARPDRDQSPPGSLLIVGQSLAPEQRALHRALLGLLAGGGLGLILSFAGAWFLSGRALIPIETAFRRQQDFIADASHELRTPLTVLGSATDLLDQNRSEPLASNGELFDDVRQEIGRLQRLVGDMLTLARSDLNELALAVAPLDITQLTADVVQRVLPLARAGDIELTFATSSLPTRPLLIEADPDRLQQVLLILIDNALKHTPPDGSIAVRVDGQGTDALIEVRDTGEGIPADQLPRVFDRFFRADMARTHTFPEGGAGLGLSIAKSLVDAHGGQLTLSSRVGEGTVATVRLPVLPAHAGWLDQLSGRFARRPGRV